MVNPGKTVSPMDATREHWIMGPRQSAQQMEQAMKRVLANLRIGAAILLIGISLSACGYNTIPTLEEQAKARWGDVQNQYQRRADLIPNLVETVKGYASQEKSVLTAVIEARAKATQIKVDASQLTDPDKLKAFQDAQDQ